MHQKGDGKLTLQSIFLLNKQIYHGETEWVFILASILIFYDVQAYESLTTLDTAKVHAVNILDYFRISLFDWSSFTALYPLKLSYHLRKLMFFDCFCILYYFKMVGQNSD